MKEKVTEKKGKAILLSLSSVPSLNININIIIIISSNYKRTKSN